MQKGGKYTHIMHILAYPHASALIYIYVLMYRNTFKITVFATKVSSIMAEQCGKCKWLSPHIVKEYLLFSSEVTESVRERESKRGSESICSCALGRVEREERQSEVKHSTERMHFNSTHPQL